MEEVLKEIDKLSEEDRTKVLFYVLAKNHIRLNKEDINIKYLHELQNLYYNIIGEELEIKEL